MPGGNKNIRPEDGKQFSKDYQPQVKWTEKDALRLGNQLLEWMKSEDENIFFDEFLHLVVNESQYPGKIYSDLPAYLGKKFSSFLELLQKARKIEEVKLKKYGAFDKLNSQIVRFLLSAEYGLSEKSKFDHTTDGKPLQPQPVTYNLVKPKEDNE